MKTIFRYFKIWLMMTTIATQTAFTSRFGAGLFLVTKILRFVFFLVFLMFLTSKVKVIAGYSLWQVALFYATFNLLDSLIQFLLREVYRFRSYVTMGYLDYILVKPISSLFRSLFGGSDILDLPIIFLSIIFIVFTIQRIGNISFINILLYILFIFNALLIAVSFHILVLSIGVLTTEVDNTIMLYRDLAQMARVPIEVYKEPISWIITFIIPIGIMISFPAKALMGLLSPPIIFISFFIGLIFLFSSLKFWQLSLRQYSSASS